MTVTDDPPRARAAHLGPEKRRPLVLDAALTVWNEHGYAGTTMALIARQAGVSKPVLYACYSDKDEVLRALLHREDRRLVAAAQGALPADIADQDAGAMLAAGFRAFFEAVLAEPDSWRIVVDAQHLDEPAITARVIRGRAEIVEQASVLVAHYFETRGVTLTARERRLHAQNLVSLAETNAAMLLRQDGADDDWTPPDLARAVADFVLTAWP